MRSLQLLQFFILGNKAEIDVYNSTLVVVDKFLSLDAYFGDSLPPDGVFGRITIANPIEACDSIETAPAPFKFKNETVLPIALISRGTCSFLDKIQAATEAGFAAAIVYTLPDDPPTGMGPTGYPEYIPSVMTTFEAGEFLKSEKDEIYVRLFQSDDPFPFPQHLLWPFASAVGGCLLIMLISTIVKLAREYKKARKGRLSRKKLNQLPIIKFNPQEHASRFESCAICIEEFKSGDKIRELPCKHGYHKVCIDPWLTSNRKVCPLCKAVVLPSSDDENSDNEDSPLIRPEGPELHDVDEERTVGWAAAFSRSSGTQRTRGPSVSSYTSLDGEVNPVYAEESTINTSTTISSEEIIPIEDGIPIIHLPAESDSDDADDESTPRNPATV